VGGGDDGKGRESGRAETLGRVGRGRGCLCEGRPEAAASARTGKHSASWSMDMVGGKSKVVNNASTHGDWLHQR
jgi:hypothetical protein